MFAAPEVRAPLLGIYALLAEWSALGDPAAELSAAQVKLGWWQEEIRRLIGGAAVHPIGIYLASLPQAAGVDFSPLAAAIDAVMAEVSGVPLERGADLAAHASAARAGPLQIAARLSAADIQATALRECTESLAAGDYLLRALQRYRLDARAGRIPFAVDELLAAGIDNDDLAAAAAPPRLEAYLHEVRRRAADFYLRALSALPPQERAQQRHLAVLAALGGRLLRRLEAGRELSGETRGLPDMLRAWSTARRAMARH